MRRAVSAVIERRRLMIALMRIGGTPIGLTRRYWDMPSSCMNSSRCSPGWIGSDAFIALPLSVVVDDFDFHRTSVGPDETHPPLVVDANAVLTGTVAAQRFETMRWRRSQVG